MICRSLAWRSAGLGGGKVETGADLARSGASCRQTEFMSVILSETFELAAEQGRSVDEFIVVIDIRCLSRKKVRQR